MDDAIVVCSAPGRARWAADCSESIHRPHFVLAWDGWELDKLRWLVGNTRFDRWLFLNDSCVIKDQGFFDLAFNAGPRSVAISNCPGKFGMYLAVYHRDTLNQVGLPHVADKEEAIRLEIEWSVTYADAEPDAPLLFTDFTDGHSQRTAVRHGRVNLVLENDWLIKYKGTWR